jgi:hypothetical protein
MKLPVIEPSGDARHQHLAAVLRDCAATPAAADTIAAACRCKVILAADFDLDQIRSPRSSIRTRTARDPHWSSRWRARWRAREIGAARPSGGGTSKAEIGVASSSARS